MDEPSLPQDEPERFALATDPQLHREFERAMAWSTRTVAARRWLWRTALAFAPVPIVALVFGKMIAAAIAGLYLLGIVRGRVRRSHPTFLSTQAQSTCTVRDDELVVDAGDRVTSWPAYSIREVHEHELGVVVIVARERWLAIPSTSFSSDEQRQQLVAKLRSFLTSERPFEPKPPRAWPSSAAIFAWTVCLVGSAIAVWSFETLWVRLLCWLVVVLCLVSLVPDQPTRPEPRLFHAGLVTYRRSPPDRKRAHIPETDDWLGPVVFASALVAGFLHSAAVAGPTGKLVLDVLALLSALLGALKLDDELEARLSRDPRQREHEIEIDAHGVTYRDIHCVESVPWSRLGELDYTDSELTLKWPDGTVYKTVPVSAFATHEEWEAFIERAEAFHDRAS